MLSIEFIKKAEEIRNRRRNFSADYEITRQERTAFAEEFDKHPASCRCWECQAEREREDDDVERSIEREARRDPCGHY